MGLPPHLGLSYASMEEYRLHGFPGPNVFSPPTVTAMASSPTATRSWQWSVKQVSVSVLLRGKTRLCRRQGLGRPHAP